MHACFLKRIQEDLEVYVLVRSLITVRYSMTHFSSPGGWTMIILKSDSNSVDAQPGIANSMTYFERRDHSEYKW
jgi:hypothetical protein